MVYLYTQNSKNLKMEKCDSSQEELGDIDKHTKSQITNHVVSVPKMSTLRQTTAIELFNP